MDNTTTVVTVTGRSRSRDVNGGSVGEDVRVLIGIARIKLVYRNAESRTVPFVFPIDFFWWIFGFSYGVPCVITRKQKSVPGTRH